MAQSEFDIIRRYFADSDLAFDRDGIALGIGDDGALLQIPSDRQLCVSLDVLVEDRHFPRGADPALVANRALAVNLSDLAAMGAVPLCFTLGLTLPNSDTEWLRGFSEGLLPLAREFDMPLIGGDLSAGPLTIAIQAHGLVAPERAIRRDGAAAGDSVYVSGYLGDAALGLISMGRRSHLDSLLNTDSDLNDECREYFQAAFYRPSPRVAFGVAVAELVSSGIDISDGLYGDLGHIATASAVAVSIQLDSLPVSPCAASCFNEVDCRWAALLGGDDYELCLTVPGPKCDDFERVADEQGIVVARVGAVASGAGVQCLDEDGRETRVPAGSYQHFHNDG